MSVLAALRGAWPATPGGGLHRRDDEASVRLFATPARAPGTPIERLLVDTLLARGPLARHALVSHVATALYREELAHGGWLADLGILGARPFVPDVARALETARGVLWEIEGSEGNCA